MSSVEQRFAKIRRHLLCGASNKETNEEKKDLASVQKITEYNYHNGHRVNITEIQLPGESEPVPYQRWASPLPQVCWEFHGRALRARARAAKRGLTL